MPRSILLFLLFGSLQLTAQNNNIRFEHIGIKEGLSNQGTTCTIQDRQGFIWIGTVFGLNRFDGVRCKTFFHNGTDSNSLIHNSIWQIAEDIHNNLWIGTQEGVSCFDPVKKIFTNYSSAHTGKYFLKAENCFAFADKQKSIWIGHNKGIAFLNPATQQFEQIPLQLSAPGKKNNEFVSSFLQDSKNRYWISTSYGIKQLDPVTKAVKQFSEYACQQIIEDRKGRIFAGTWFNGLLFFDETKNEFRNIPVSHISPDPKNCVHSILPVVQNGTDYLLLGTENGMIRIKTDDLLNGYLQYEYYLPDKFNDQSISHNAVFHLSEDRSSNIWIVTADGINKIDPHNQYFQLSPISSDLSFEWWPKSIAEDFNSKQRIYVGTAVQLFSYSKVTQKFDAVTLPVTKIDLTDMTKGKANYWLATQHGLLQCNRDMKFIRSYGLNKSRNSLSTDHLYSVCEDHLGMVWIGTVKKGVNILDPATGNIRQLELRSRYENNLNNSFINVIIEDNHENVWIGSTGGLYRFKRSTGVTEEYKTNKDSSTNILSDNIISLKETHDGKIWIGTRQGLRYFDYSNNSFITVQPKNEQTSEYINGIEEDSKGILWLATNNGLQRYDPVKKAFSLYNTNNGLPENDLTNVFQQDSDGNIYAGLFGKMVVFKPDHLKQNDFAPDPVITDINIDNIPLSNTDIKRLEIRYDQNIQLNFVSLNYSNSSGNQYAYLLEGLDKDWVQTGNIGTVRFSGLPPGTYTLKIKAANNDAVWNGHPVEILLLVRPPFWKTWWFISLAILTISAFLFLLYRYRMRRLLEMERLRTRIATDLHDDIGATLSSISMYSDAIKKEVKEKMPHLENVLDKMGENSRDMVSSMSDIVWAINPKNDTGEKLSSRIENYAKDICSVKNIQLEYMLNERINQLDLTLEQRKNSYLIFKEALNNAVKYSAASCITLKIDIQRNKMQMEIADNGKGFDPIHHVSGNGLKNMRMRAQEIKGTLEVISDQNGTKVQLEYDL